MNPVPRNTHDTFPLLPTEAEAERRNKKCMAMKHRKLAAAKYRPVTRGEIYYANLNPVVGSEQGGERPVLIIQNDIGNKHSSTVIVAPITSQTNKAKLPTHTEVTLPTHPQNTRCIALAEQIRTIDKTRLGDKLGVLGDDEMAKVSKALRVSLALG